MTRWIWRLCGSLWYNCNITQVWCKDMGLLTTTQTLQSTQMGAVNMFCLTIHQNRYSWQNTLLWYELIINDILCYYGIFVLRLTTSGMVYKQFGFSWEKDLNLSSRIVNTWPRNSGSITSIYYPHQAPLRWVQVDIQYKTTGMHLLWHHHKPFGCARSENYVYYLETMQPALFTYNKKG